MNFLLLLSLVGQDADRQALLDRITALEKRLSVLETKPAPGGPVVVAPAPKLETPPAPEESKTTVNVTFDGYYLWNTNRPIGGDNLLRAYDVRANNLSINQTGVVLERAVTDTSRWGYRLDLLWGQATQTLQGNPANEPRPDLYRNVFQAYGTYVAPVGKGLTMDFGKWASALGPEGNYTKDQINYSRSYFFNFLPFYHMGLRATYPVNDKLSVQYWVVNGANQTEDFNGFKSQLAQVVYKPAKNLTWTTNYYNGREQREVNGVAPRGKFQVIDTYAFWNATSKLTLGAEFDYVINRVDAHGPPQSIVGGAGYLRYQIAPKWYFGQRYTRLNDNAGLFSGASQNLNDTTSTIGFRPSGDGFEARLEYRRDFSNVPYFLTRNAGVLAKQQNTITLGLLWWFGGKNGTW